ncbi:MAG TPA: carbohydrate-binding protein [Polyangia bacterium]|nr:carbohydrate-binding protein [Polyangia bacterium]
MGRIAPALFAAAVCVWIGSSAACVDTGHRAQTADGSTGPGAVQPATCQGTPPVAYAGDAGIPSADPAPAGPYAWKNVVIEGGGFVSGIVMSPALPGLAFARTDVGGAYRYDPANQRWMPLTDWVGHSNSNLIGIESIATDPTDPNNVYLAAGQYLTAGNGAILSSTDMGQTWTTNAIGAPMGGNVDGRSMGERLAVDPNLPSTLYFGSRNAGLWESTDSAQTWTQVAGLVDPATGVILGAGAGNSAGTGYGLTFVLFDPSSGVSGTATPVIYVGVGVTTGNTLYRSTDAGVTWNAVTGAPTGMMPHHAVLDGCGNLYLAYNNGSGPNGVTAGAVWRYGTASGAWTDVSPVHGSFGFGGISADAAHPGTLIVTTIDFWSPGEIYRTTNGGASWVPLEKAAAWDVEGAEWLYWHTTGLPQMGWMGDVEIDPFDSSHARFITGQGLWSSDDVTMADSGAATHWTFDDSGLEETVVLDLASPLTGAPLLSGVGDIGGFKHDDLGVSPPGGMFSNPIFSNTNSLDFAESNPNIVARVGTTSSSTGTNGATSMDGGATWTPFPLANVPQVSTSSGTVYASAGSIAVSADGATFVWVPARKGSSQPPPSYSSDHGTTWTASAGLSAGLLVAADRVNASTFYAGGQGKTMYVSTDGGKTFTAVTTASSGRPRPVFGVAGDVWVPTGTGLLHSQDAGATFPAVAGVTGATAVGFGAPVQANQTYPSVYLAGSVLDSGTASYAWGIYRSDDAGASWQHLDDAQHQFGYINCMAGDRRQAGRLYLGTSGRGIVYGDPQ